MNDEVACREQITDPYSVYICGSLLHLLQPLYVSEFINDGTVEGQDLKGVFSHGRIHMQRKKPYLSKTTLINRVNRIREQKANSVFSVMG
jgi:hypothetical protein